MKKICIVIQSAAFLASAGMRIRYERFIDGAGGDDVEVMVSPLADLLGQSIDCDAYVFCKTFSADAILFAYAVKKAGKIVAQDLFDDYFSQEDDQRLLVYRNWLRAIEPYTDSIICTTSRMRDVLVPFFPGKQISVIEDPISGYDPIRIEALIDRKYRAAVVSQKLRLIWFGIGDNPYFRVGLADLTAASMISELARLSSSGWDVSLTVATNLRALDAHGLASLRRIPVPVDLVEWTEDVEQAALAKADIALLPVGSQPFSRAKSLNRAVTALNQGCQVLSIGEPLYEALGGFLYRSAAELLADFAEGRSRLRPERMAELTALFARTANAYEAGRKFKSAILDQERSAAGSLAVVHGWQSSITVHKLAGRHGAISVSSPFCETKWNFPLRFDVVGDRIVMKAATDFAVRHQISVRSDTTQKIADFLFMDVAPDTYPALPPVVTDLKGMPFRSAANYPGVMQGIDRAIAAILPGTKSYVSDLSPFRCLVDRRI